MTAVGDTPEGSSFVCVQYTSCAISPAQREVIMGYYYAMKERGLSRTEFEELTAEAGFPRAPPHIQHLACVFPRAGNRAPPLKKRGRKAALDDEKTPIVVGHCLTKIRNHEGVSLQTVISYAKDSWGLTLSESTACRFLNDNGFSLRIAKNSSAGYLCDVVKASKIYYKWIREAREAGLFPSDPGLLGSLDFAYTRHSTERPQTYAVVGR